MKIVMKMVSSSAQKINANFLSLKSTDLLFFQGSDGKGQREDGDAEIKLLNTPHDVIVLVGQKVGQVKKR